MINTLLADAENTIINGCMIHSLVTHHCGTLLYCFRDELVVIAI